MNDKRKTKFQIEFEKDVKRLNEIYDKLCPYGLIEKER